MKTMTLLMSLIALATVTNAFAAPDCSQAAIQAAVSVQYANLALSDAAAALRGNLAQTRGHAEYKNASGTTVLEYSISVSPEPQYAANDEATNFRVITETSCTVLKVERQ